MSVFETRHASYSQFWHLSCCVLHLLLHSTVTLSCISSRFDQWIDHLGRPMVILTLENRGKSGRGDNPRRLGFRTQLAVLLHQNPSSQTIVNVLANCVWIILSCFIYIRAYYDQLSDEHIAPKRITQAWFAPCLIMVTANYVLASSLMILPEYLCPGAILAMMSGVIIPVHYDFYGRPCVYRIVTSLEDTNSLWLENF